MKRRIIQRTDLGPLSLALAALSLALVISSPAAAQKLELSPFLGYRFGGDFEARGNAPFFFTVEDFEVDETSSYGLLLDIGVTRNLQVELMLSRQETELRLETGVFGPPDRLFDLDVDYYHAGVLYQWTPGQVRPFVVGTLGATRLAPEPAALADETHFSASLGAGVKLLFTRNLGVRFEGRLFSTVIDNSDDRIFCDRFGFCEVIDVDEYLDQAEIRGGLVFAF